MIVWELEIRVGLVGGGVIGISGRPKILLAEVEEAIKTTNEATKTAADLSYNHRCVIINVAQ